MSGNLVYTLHLWPPLGHAGHYTGTTPERRLAQRLADHALGRGARLTQVQLERGGFWVLAQTQPGGRTLERRLKQHGATRRCEVCKAASAYPVRGAGRAGGPGPRWVGPVQSGAAVGPAGHLRPARNHPRCPPRTPRRRRPVRPAAAPPPPVPAPRAEPWPWPGRPVPAGPELEGVVEALIQGWTTPEPTAQPPPEPVVEAGL